MARRATVIDRSRKADRLEARLTPAQKDLIARAAQIKGATLTEFVVRSAQEAASQTIREHEVLVLRDEARDVFVKALLESPAPSKAARNAAAKYLARIGAS